MSALAGPYLSADGWDHTAILVCERDECMVTSLYENDSSGRPRRTYWQTEVQGMTPEQVTEVRNEHVKGHTP